MPRMKSFNEDIALRQALELFWTKGYKATSLSDLTQELKIGKGSFYDTFGSKRKLFERCLLLYQNNSFAMIDKLLFAKLEPRKVIRNILNNHTGMMLSAETPQGCLIANSTTELADDPMVKEFLKGYNQMIRTKLKAFFTDSIYANQMEERIDLLLIHMTGISVMSKIVKDPKRFRLANDLFMRRFEV